MSRKRFHLEEHLEESVVDGLKRRGIDVLTTIDEMRGVTNENHLALTPDLDIHHLTVFRYRKYQSVPSAEVQDRLAKIREISILLDEVFTDSDAQLEWLCRPSCCSETGDPSITSGEGSLMRSSPSWPVIPPVLSH